jgi:PAS domain S-box-containing protein
VPMASTRDDVARRASHLRPEAKATRARILVVDDDEAALRPLAKLLGAEGFETSTAADGESALAEAMRVRPDLVLTDLQMQPMDGIELCKRLHELDPELPVIVMTGSSDLHPVIDSLRQRAEDYLLKPLESDVVLWCVERALTRRAAKRDHEDIQRAFNERLVLSSVREREHAEAEAQHAAQLRSLLENLTEGVLIADPHCDQLMVNEAARAVMGLAQEKQRAEDLYARVAMLDLEERPLAREERPLVRALRGERFTDYEVLYVRPSGERRRVVSSGTSVRDQQGSVALAIVVLRDVTELRRLEQQRDEYLSLVSHDLRNPLSVVSMSVATLKTAITDKRVPVAARAKLVERVERNAKRMNVMLDELREATSLETQGVTLQCAPCDMRELVDNVVDSIDDARRRITVETDGASGYIVLADAPRLERVVANLLTNALKYSAEGAPVSVRLAHREGAVVVAVTDRGIGIAPESVMRLFDRNYRTTGGKAHASGLGLGLYIARMIVELLGGRIEVESELGKGSTFRLIVPLHAVAR